MNSRIGQIYAAVGVLFGFALLAGTGAFLGAIGWLGFLILAAVSMLALNAIFGGGWGWGDEGWFDDIWDGGSDSDGFFE